MIIMMGRSSNKVDRALVVRRFVAGVILRECLPAFERMLWRACRGNVFLRQAEIDTPLEDPVTGDQVVKSVFIIFFQGEQLKSRVKKICEGFRATLYPCPETPADRREMSLGVMTRIEDLNTVLGQTQDHRHRVLVAAAKNIKSWFVKVRKIKAIYHTLNLFNLDVTQKCLIAECWCAVNDLDHIQLALRRGTDNSGSSVPSILNRMDTKEVPPTYNRANKFTAGFQNIVDAYGVANYREVNPALFTVITFPFLFAVMFGDAGHGLIMTLFGAWMVLKEKGLAAQKNPDEIWKMFFNGRYMILLMGSFSIYTGLIYNDMFSKSLSIFSSHWRAPERVPGANAIYLRDYQLNPAKNYLGTPYPFGIDPVWQLAENKINFINSYKMKLSVIFGVIHMVFGVLLGYWNHRFVAGIIDTPTQKKLLQEEGLTFEGALDIALSAESADNDLHNLKRSEDAHLSPQHLHAINNPCKHCVSCRDRYFNRRMNIYAEFIPQLVFMLSIFGYLVLMVFAKWIAYDSTQAGCAPSLLISLINMLLFKYPGEKCEPCHLCPMYGGQQVIQSLLVVIALICIPWMLLVKPYMIYKARQMQYSLPLEIMAFMIYKALHIQVLLCLPDAGTTLVDWSQYSLPLEIMAFMIYKACQMQIMAFMIYKACQMQIMAFMIYKACQMQIMAFMIYKACQMQIMAFMIYKACQMQIMAFMIYKACQMQALSSGPQNAHQNAADVEAAVVVPPNPHGEEEESISDIFINQAIHTIEYCLGSISHTASYLRLWALSLAHAQLSEVLWTMIMRYGLGVGGWFGGVVLYLIFAVWAVLTLGVLLLMEGLSAFLHALRLHWVEFQSKFYGGMGYKFLPFSFNTILASLEAE
ncbi:unc-32 [Cordylochernes scorpioides]|uniref:V-type proton ATPase subunit a n=1 Tax=Cordylochernes scorpioides TaxID=51811 RepID=A0ABY6LI12_9ARAC|nr:unc-32 [Cordylochernes scorpioides]